MLVKICGLTQGDDVEAAVDAGADLLGINLIPSSKRAVSPERARDLCAAARGRAATVLVVADLAPDMLRALRRSTQADWLQLHGHETPDQVRALGRTAFKALRLGDEHDVAYARKFPGHPLLLDAKVAGELGGTGKCLDLGLTAPLFKERAALLAGGLSPENVGDAIRRVEPFGVDVASGVELPGNPRRKSGERMRAFVRAARRAGTEVAMRRAPTAS